MLLELVVKDFALIEQAELAFTKGLNIITGETGAGKSILIGALKLLAGERASGELIRGDKEKAVIQALFDISELEHIKIILKEFGFAESSDLLLYREINRNGNNKIRINGQLSSLQQLKLVVGNLLDIHGQHAQQSLLKKEKQLALVDSFNPDQDLMRVINQKYKQLIDLKKKLLAAENQQLKRQHHLELLSFQLAELKKLGLKENESADLQKELKILSNAETLYQTCYKIYLTLSGAENTSGQLSVLAQLLKDLQKATELDVNLEDLLKLLENTYYSLNELSFLVRDYADKVVFDQQRLLIVQERLAEINHLQRKYGENLTEVYQKIENEHKQLKDFELATKNLAATIRNLEADYYQQAKKISQNRKEIKEKIESRLEESLADLAMDNVKFSIAISPLQKSNYSIRQGHEEIKINANGIDDLEFFIATNKGDSVKALSKIASGGELSRIMLAFKAIASDLELVPTMIFDEVDTGIGGRTAWKVGEKLALIGQNRQVLVITHLPQIACFSDNHLQIKKYDVAAKTKTEVKVLSDQDKVAEINTLLAGTQSDIGKDHALSMIERSKKIKAKLQS